MMNRMRVTALAGSLVLLTGLSPGSSWTAAAGPASTVAAVEDFYTPPDPLPKGRPGDVIRSEPASTTLSVLAEATRVMYLSTEPNGKPIAVTGMVLDPAAEWSGPGERPLVGYTVGTHGQGDQCAPSKLLSEGVHYSPPLDLMFEYESLFIADLLSQGMAVVVTDYQGLGTPGTHTYFNRAAHAQANIDAVRAAQRLHGSGIPTGGPVGFSGYSQGGGAAAATAELVGSYGRELDVVGTYAGAAPSDMQQLWNYLDGTALTGVIGYYVNGMAQASPKTRPVLDALLNDAGMQMIAEVAGQCVLETDQAYGMRQSSEFTVSGKSIPDALAAHPVTRRAMERDRVGNRTPSAPVLLLIGDNDDIVPPEGVRALAAAWCARGATVDLYEIPLPMLLPGFGPGHIGNAAIGYPAKARGWLHDRFTGQPAPNTCEDA